MIFSEKKYAEKLLENGFSKFMYFPDLVVLARYYKYLGQKRSQIYDSLIIFCKKYNREFNEILYYNKIKRAMRSADKYFLRCGNSINITKSEMQTILSVDDYKKQKILFVALAIAKYFKKNKTIKNPKPPTEYSDNYYMHIKLTNILKIAKVNISKKERYALFYFLKNEDFISETSVGSIQVNFVNEDSPIEVKIKDMDKIISFFPFYCENCGKKYDPIFKQRHRMCEECYRIYRQKREGDRLKKYMRKIRNK